MRSSSWPRASIFLDIIREGIALYELNDHHFVYPRPQTAADAYTAAKDYFEDWSKAAHSFLDTFQYLTKKGENNHAAFDITLSSAFTAAIC